MPEINISGPAGRIEARYHHEPGPNAPVALILHPHPQFGGTMNNQVVYHLYYSFQRRGFSVLRFNFRGVGRSEGLFDNGPGELADAATALDWLQAYNTDAATCVQTSHIVLSPTEHEWVFTCPAPTATGNQLLTGSIQDAIGYSGHVWDHFDIVAP